MTVAAVALVLAPGVCRPASEVSIHAQKQGDAVVIEAHALLQVPPAVIWATLTDYDHLSTFVPGLHASRVVERRGAATWVKQQGQAGLLFFTRPIDVVVEATERPPDVIEMRLISGNMKQLDGRYRIEASAEVPGQVALSWFGIIEPQDNLPPLVGVPVMRSNVADQFRSIVAEIERRAQQSRPVP